MFVKQRKYVHYLDTVGPSITQGMHIGTDQKVQGIVLRYGEPPTHQPTHPPTHTHTQTRTTHTRTHTHTDTHAHAHTHTHTHTHMHTHTGSRYMCIAIQVRIIAKYIKGACQPSQFTHRGNYVHKILNVLCKQCSTSHQLEQKPRISVGRIKIFKKLFFIRTKPTPL